MYRVQKDLLVERVKLVQKETRYVSHSCLLCMHIHDPVHRLPSVMNGTKGDMGNVGPQGDRGDRGPKGFMGQKGEMGDNGTMGDQGPQGMYIIASWAGPNDYVSLCSRDVG